VSDLPPPPPADDYTYTDGERRPVEVLVFEVEPDHVDAFLRVDHEVWTLGEANTPGHDGIPFESKEVWLNDNRPGQITVVFVWPDRASWEAVDQPSFQQQLTDAFDRRFGHPYRLVRAIHDEERMGIHRWSRFERI
jgi:uncharacterized protein (TIGR03792 family)